MLLVKVKDSWWSLSQLVYEPEATKVTISVLQYYFLFFALFALFSCGLFLHGWNVCWCMSFMSRTRWGLFNWEHCRWTEQDFLIIPRFNPYVSVRETCTWFMSSTLGLLRLEAGKNNVPMGRETHFCSKKWLLDLHRYISHTEAISVILHQNNNSLHTHILLFVQDEASSRFYPEFSLPHWNIFS